MTSDWLGSAWFTQIAGSSASSPAVPVPGVSYRDATGAVPAGYAVATVGVRPIAAAAATMTIFLMTFPHSDTPATGAGAGKGGSRLGGAPALIRCESGTAATGSASHSRRAPRMRARLADHAPRSARRSQTWTRE